MLTSNYPDFSRCTSSISAFCRFFPLQGRLYVLMLICVYRCVYDAGQEKSGSWMSPRSVGHSALVVFGFLGRLFLASFSRLASSRGRWSGASFSSNCT